MNFGTSNPASTAFFANKPAVKITLGLLLFVEEAIDADSIVPWRSEYSFPSKKYIDLNNLQWTGHLKIFGD